MSAASPWPMPSRIRVLVGDFHPHHHFGHPSSNASPSSNEPIPGFEDILVVLKTGATEALTKLPVHFSTTLRNIPHHVVYSDHAEEIAGHRVYDALDEVDEAIRNTNPDFELYNRLNSGEEAGGGRSSIQAAELDDWTSATNTVNGAGGNPAWRLDKWKFLPMVDKALRHRPDAKWYVFVEADTYVVWKNLLEFLSHFDAEKPQYLGMQMSIGDVTFAYGGAGFMISNAAMRRVTQHRAQHLPELDQLTAFNWAGDCVLGKAMMDAGMTVFWGWPNIQSGQPTDNEYGVSYPDNKMAWCFNAVSYHHASPEEIEDFWRWNQDWDAENSTLLQHRDIFRYYLLPKLSPQRDDWDNLSDLPPLPERKIDSYEKCRLVCESLPDCMQFSYSYMNCRTSPFIRLGHRDLTGAKGAIRSGWMMDRINAIPASMPACSEQVWKYP
ncbi:glycosyltransferase family 31 protein [Saccharata proteae CBS 121410]|uniref:N-acetylgalactosaminide beta-1,3-galactosyltransferase n=1 Tax=Saccharata proteae CBS 121410 TaxID=1314787 RepID=A0A9P4LT66_9PEZI|nr:glycosyltransferase family 31 protein [Saccharata proteae CBS 121410]